MPIMTTADGRTLAYALRGEGPMLISHPGGPGFSGAYLEDLGGLDQTRTLVALDPRGAGRSHAPADSTAYALADYVADLGELQDHLGAERIDLLGHSHGSLVSIMYAARHPERINRLVLVGTGARFHEGQVQTMHEAIEQRVGEPWFDDALAALEDEQEGRFGDDAELGKLVARELPFYFARYGEREQAFVRTALEQPVHAAALACFNAGEFLQFDLRPELPRISAPTLVVAGEQDFILGPEACAEVASGIASGRLVVMAGVGHMPWVEDSDGFAAVVEGFLGP